MAESYLSKRLVQSVVFDLRSDLYAHLQSLSLGIYETRGAGDIMSRALGDVGAVAGGFMGPMVRFAAELTQLAWALCLPLRIDAPLTLISLAVVPPPAYAVYRFGDRMRDLAWRMRGRQSKLWSFLAENVSGIREIKAFGRERRELARFRDHTRAIDRLGLEDSLLNEVLTFCTGLPFFSAGEMVVLLVGGLAVYRGSMASGNLTAFLMYVRMLCNPVITISRRHDQTLHTMASAVRVFELFDTVPDIQDGPGAQELPMVRGEVRFEDVSFRHREDQEVLQDISLVAAPGKTVALVGHSGGGKTTLSKLVPRFYDPDQWAVLLDGQDLRSVTIRSLRQQISVVFQQPFLFNGTIRENIAYGKPDATEAEVLSVALAANVHPFVTELPEQYETVIGERGIRLSGGQRQRVAIARALLKDPRILILDEATSSVDSETEQPIQDASGRLLQGRTSIVIAHRQSTVLHADRILVIEGGRIVERGRHSTLLAIGSVHSDLYYAQFERQGRSLH